jgi:hypothetical protein
VTTASAKPRIIMPATNALSCKSGIDWLHPNVETLPPSAQHRLVTDFGSSPGKRFLNSRIIAPVAFVQACVARSLSSTIAIAVALQRGKDHSSPACHCIDLALTPDPLGLPESTGWGPSRRWVLLLPVPVQVLLASSSWRAPAWLHVSTVAARRQSCCNLS